MIGYKYLYRIDVRIQKLNLVRGFSLGQKKIGTFECDFVSNIRIFMTMYGNLSDEILLINKLHKFEYF